MMKSLWGALTALLLLWSYPSVAAETHYELQVDGLVCPFCEHSIEKNLGKIEGVKMVKANLKEGTVVMLVADGHTVSEQRIRQAITDAGFTLTSIESHTPGKPE